MLCASQGQWTITSATSILPAATPRLSSARARRIWLARARARMFCGPAGAIGAVAFMFRSPRWRREAPAAPTSLLHFDECAIAMTAEIKLRRSRGWPRYVSLLTMSLGRAPNGHGERAPEATPARVLGQPRARGSYGGSGLFLLRGDL